MSSTSKLPAASRLGRGLRLALPVAAAGLLVQPAGGQSFGLDDNPAAPLVGPPSLGFGAEDPYQLAGPPLAPSPSLAVLGPLGDGAWLAPGPVLQHPGPNGFYISAFSAHHPDDGLPILLEFSGDRQTIAQPGSPYNVEAGNGQAHGDIYTSTHAFVSPGTFAGTLPPPFAGPLPAIAGGVPGHVLTIDESAFGLLTSGGVVPPGVPVPRPVVSPGQHDNVDSWDRVIFDPDGDNLFNTDAYFALYPAEAFPVGLSPADVVVVAAGDGGAIPVAYASSFQLGLDPFDDAIDALVMYDHNNKPVPLSGPAPPGAVEPVIDYALFSLAPGSLSLQLYGLSAGDVLYTDFSGAFGLYASAPDLDLIPAPGGPPFGGDNVDALDVVPAPEVPLVLRDGRCTYRLTNTVGERLTANGGLARLTTGATSHVVQNWFWYRGSGDTREYALSNRIFLANGPNNVRMVYLEPVFDGGLPGALLVDLEYTLSDLGGQRGADPSTCARCELVIAIRARNLTPEPLDVALFAYNDMDLNGDAGGDAASIAGIDNQVQLVTDVGPGGTGCWSGGVFKVSSSDHVRWEMDKPPLTVSRLADNVVDVLSDALSPLGPTNYGGAQQWEFLLGPAGAVLEPPFDGWIGSVVKEAVVTLPGDVDGNCTVDLNDLLFLLANFGIVCTP